jgi:glycosyltransferase involved in cell wall biosynthesis
MSDRPLRFCMITTFYPPYNFGGDGIFVKRLSNELAQRGHSVDVIHCLDSYRMLSGQQCTGTYNDRPGVTVHGLKSRFGLLSPLATQQTGLPFFKQARIREILKKPFDVINYHNISLVGGPKILELGQGIKLYTMHEYWLVCPTHVLFRFNRAPCTRPHCLTCSLFQKRPPQWWRYLGLLESAAKHVDAFIALSSFSEREHRRRGFDFPMVHIPGFVASAESASPRLGEVVGEAQAKPYFLFVGRLEKLKGLQTLIPVFHDQPSVQLLIAGAGSYGSRLRQMAEGSANVRFLDQLPEHHLQRLYEHAVAVIVPSLSFEIFPLVPVEAFRQRTPVIARDLGALGELVEESRGGLLYDNEEELRQAMDRLLEDRFYRNELGQRGYEAYQQNWTVEAHLRRYLALIHDLSSARA